MEGLSSKATSVVLLTLGKQCSVCFPHFKEIYLDLAVRWIQSAKLQGSACSSTGSNISHSPSFCHILNMRYAVRDV